MKKIAIFGAGGMGRETVCIIQRINQTYDTPVWNFIGFYDDGLPIGETNDMGTVLGGLKELNAVNDQLAIVIAVGNPQIISRITKAITNKQVYYPNIIDPTTDYWNKESVRIGKGNIVCPHCSFSCNVEIGDFNILNGYVSIRHDVSLGNCNSVMPGVKISGGVNVGNRNFFGINAAVTQYLTIADDIKVGAGAIVMNSIKDSALYVGVPAKAKENI